MGQTIGSGHVVYLTPRFEFMNEGFIVQHKVEETGAVFNTPAFYSLISTKIGARVPTARRRTRRWRTLKPSSRYSR